MFCSGEHSFIIYDVTDCIIPKEGTRGLRPTSRGFGSSLGSGPEDTVPLCQVEPWTGLRPRDE